MPQDLEKVFETQNLDLAAYLMLQGLRYLDCRIEHDAARGRPLATVRLDDPKTTARDLERLFMTSAERRYRDLHKYLLREVHQEVRRYVSGVGNDDGERG